MLHHWNPSPPPRTSSPAAQPSQPWSLWHKTSPAGPYRIQSQRSSSSVPSQWITRFAQYAAAATTPWPSHEALRSALPSQSGPIDGRPVSRWSLHLNVRFHHHHPARFMHASVILLRVPSRDHVSNTPQSFSLRPTVRWPWRICPPWCKSGLMVSDVFSFGLATNALIVKYLDTDRCLCGRRMDKP